MPGKRRLRPLVMPAGMKELIRFALDPLQLRPTFDAEDVLAYRTGYESGIELTAVILFVSEPKLLFLKRPAMSISVLDAVPEMTSIRCEYITLSFRAPDGPYGVRFSVKMLSQFVACSRALADELVVRTRRMSLLRALSGSS